MKKEEFKKKYNLTENQFLGKEKVGHKRYNRINKRAVRP